MSDIHVISKVVDQTARRRRWQQGWASFWKGFLGSAWVLAAGMIIYKVAPVPAGFLLGCVGVAALIPAIAFAFGFSRPSPAIEAARWLDRNQSLQDRLSTALEVSDSKASQDWKELVIQDAARFARDLRVAVLMPFHLPRRVRWVALLLALTAGLGFVPEYRSAKYLETQRDAQIIKSTGRQLADLTKRALDQKRPVVEQTRQAMERVQELGGKLERASLSKDQAMKDLAAMSDKLKEQAKEMPKAETLKRMQQAAKDPAAQTAAASTEMQKQMDAMQKAIGNKDAKPDALEKMKSEMEKLQKAAAAMQANPGQSSEDVKRQMAEALANLARQSQALGMSMPNLDEAIKALESSDVSQFMKDMKAAEKDLEKMLAMAKALQQMQAGAGKMGKDLAEQLKNGQAEAAQKTLEKMAQQLKEGTLSQEQMQKMLDEISRAVKPASEYGAVSQMLKEAMSNMKSGKKGEASQSLADAAKELKKLMEEMGDAQSLMAMMDSLQRAQMAIGDGNAWRPGKRPGLGKGGRPGKGVGTWADENATGDVEETELWDNSGVQRPDMDAKGFTDRGDGQLAETVSPTKLQGQMNPGAPMPSITLRGLSIRGQSKLSYQEAVSAAQSEAQSALSHEQVPRAYQGAVKDYFDDLKK